jgi:hypothetical protein
MNLLIASNHFAEDDFYRRLSAELAQRGHTATHVVASHPAAEAVRKAGFAAYALPDLMQRLGPLDQEAELARIERTYATATLRDVYITDPAANHGESERTDVERTIRQFLAMERIFDEVRPQFVIPDMTRASLPIVAHLIGLERKATVLWVMHSIFKGRMRVYANTYHAPAFPPEDVRELEPEERAEIEHFIDGFIRKAKPVLEYRNSTITKEKLLKFARLVTNRLYRERDHVHLRPYRFFLSPLKVRMRRALSRSLWGSLDSSRPFVYFPLHYATDFKIERVIPHCADQEYLIRLVAQSLPQGYDLVVKEHPYSIGRNSFSMLRRLDRIPNVRLVNPFTSSHELMRAASAITVISSTVGIEALMYGKPVLTMGQPYYAGYGVTQDIDSFREIREAVPALLDFRPDPERVLQFLHASLRATYPGAPDWIDSSDENIARAAASLDDIIREHAAEDGAPRSVA